MKVKISADEISVTIPRQRPKLSASGKSMVIATSRGKQQTGAKVDGKSVFVVANAFVEVDQDADLAAEKPAVKRGKKKS
jgi:hypothetical protein